MRVPIRHLAGHILWSTHGGVWGVWRVTAIGGRYVPDQVREEVLGRVTSLVRSLAGTPRLFGLCAQVDPAEVAERMVAGVDLERCPGWAQTVEAGLDLLEEQEMHTRTLWLVVPLSASVGSRAAVSAMVGSVWADTQAAFGLPPTPVRRAEVDAYREQADWVAATLGSGLPLRPASPAEIVWMVQHAVHRGMDEPLLSDAETDGQYGGRMRDGVLHSPSYADLGQARLAEGGRALGTSAHQDTEEEEVSGRQGRRAAADRKPWWRAAVPSPLRRNWLQVEAEAGTGYQAHLVLAEVPPAVSEDVADLFAQLESLPFPVDFLVELEILSADRAKEQLRKKKNELVDQADQWDAKPSGMPGSLPSAAKDLGEEDARLSRSSVEVEVQPVTVLTVWDREAETCDARARTLTGLLRGADYRAVRAVGLQERLLTFGLPGTSWPPTIRREFRQVQLAEDWAMSGAVTDTAVGDQRGALIGIDLDCGTVRPVLVDVADAPQQQASASVGVIGDLGSGKSVLEKLLTISVVDRGDRAIVIDRTPVREWAAFAETAAPDTCQVIDAAAARMSIDPLRIFEGPTGAHYAMSYLALQLGIGPMTTTGAVLHRAVEEAAAAPAPSMAAVLTALAAMADSDTAGPARRDAAQTLTDLLQIVVASPLADMVFDPELPPLRLDDPGHDLVVITTAGLTLPPMEAFAQPEVLRQQPLEALIGRAVMYLIAAIARQAAFTDPTRFCQIVMDECYWLTSSAEGRALAHEITYDGRKHNAAGIFGAPDESHLHDVSGLLAYKALGRTTDPARARRGLEFLGLSPQDEDLVRLVTTGLSPVGKPGREGEMLLRFPSMQVGRIKVIVPAVARMDQIFTTPGDLPGRRVDLRKPEPATAPNPGRQA
ncbi:ATP-binding protein [Streptomyces melanosporofaciens]|uniref:AAA-like domain-containing protein n=1 Tax=Streptomyces melanosporofaciens TaxID=67327 RepID=A0A1H4IEL4_STRMJ|nr:ATP-binding protein [Streptomyces melanosporofaciens]SEB31702.1 AAA-like domain-containing protein [Streptomyces melanosporofaciens]